MDRQPFLLSLMRNFFSLSLMNDRPSQGIPWICLVHRLATENRSDDTYHADQYCDLCKSNEAFNKTDSYLSAEVKRANQNIF